MNTTLNVNGFEYAVEIEPHASLLTTVREQIGLTGAKEGCDDSECGACMMLLDGDAVNSCSYLALQAEGRKIETVEGLAPPGELSVLQRAFLECGGVQCGFCTPGMLISATALLRSNGVPSEEEVRISLSGNLCRCTGYEGIIEAVLEAADTNSTMVSTRNRVDSDVESLDSSGATVGMPNDVQRRSRPTSSACAARSQAE